jgi:hypothetical protein
MILLIYHLHFSLTPRCKVGDSVLPPGNKILSVKEMIGRLSKEVRQGDPKVVINRAF